MDITCIRCGTQSNQLTNIRDNEILMRKAIKDRVLGVLPPNFPRLICPACVDQLELMPISPDSSILMSDQIRTESYHIQENVNPEQSDSSKTDTGSQSLTDNVLPARPIPLREKRKNIVEPDVAEPKTKVQDALKGIFSKDGGNGRQLRSTSQKRISSSSENEASISGSRNASQFAPVSPPTGMTPGTRTYVPQLPDSDSSLSSDASGPQLRINTQPVDDGSAHSNVAAPKRTRFVAPLLGSNAAARPNKSSFGG